jgi:hypothetical protein
MTTSNAGNSNKEVMLTSTEEGYTFEQLTDNSPYIETVYSPILIDEDKELGTYSNKITTEAFAKAKASAAKGFKKAHTIGVPYPLKELQVRVTWKDTNAKLSVTTYTPSRIPLGTDYDQTDGTVDKAICIKILSPQTGDWMFEICGDSSVKYSFEKKAFK